MWAVLAPTLLCASDNDGDVLVILGLPEKLMEEARQYAESQLVEPFNATIKTIAEIEQERSSAVAGNAETHARLILGAGVDGCRSAFERGGVAPILCLLLSQRSFLEVQQEYPSVPAAALVVDQPVNRQITVANSLFPALKRFSVLASSEVDQEALPPTTRSLSFVARPGSDLAPSIADAVSGSDALVAVPDNDVFTRKTLRTVMLTAYGYGKPVIGYSKAYVRAGALMTTYSTVRQCFLNAGDLVREFFNGQDILERVHSPRYFSIEINNSIARSLKLVHRQRDLELDWNDEDFSS